MTSAPVAVAKPRPRHFSVIDAMLGALASWVIVIIGLAIWIYYLGVTTPFSFTATTYTPEQGVVCPGQTLAWMPHATIEATPDRPISFQVVTTVWSVEQQRTAITDPAPFWVNRHDNSDRAGRATWPVAALAPGRYELLRHYLAPGRRTVGYAVPFTVPTECPQ